MGKAEDEFHRRHHFRYDAFLAAAAEGVRVDLADAVRIEDLQQSAVFMAVMAWQTAMSDDGTAHERGC